MLHKEQAYQQIDRTVMWNFIRNNTDQLSWELEISMLQEELDELKAATTEVDRLDALMDLKFVLIGSCRKLGLSTAQIVDSYEAVIRANEMKGTEKNSDGKVIKPTNWSQYAPEPRLQEILDAR